MKRLLQQRHGVARLTDAVIEQLRTLHPQNDTALSEAEGALLTRNLRNTTPLATVDPARLASIIARKVNNGSAPGPSGWTGHHLHVLMEDEDCAKGITALITDIRNGALTGRDVRNRLLASALIPISKPNGSLRPIAMCETFYKTAALYAMSEVQEELPKLFPRIQFGVATPGGSERAAHLITNTRALMSASRSDIIVLSTDFKNAFNAASRAQVRRAVLGNERCRPLWLLFEYAYGASSLLHLYAARTGDLVSTITSCRGVRQGDPLAAFAFALCVQPLYERVTAGLAAVSAVAIQDDLTLIGPAKDVFAAYDRLVTLAPEYHLDLQADKCKLLLPAMAARAPEDAMDIHNIEEHAQQRGLPTCRTLLPVLGARIACSEADEGLIDEECLAEARGHSVMFERLSHKLMQDECQTGLLLLRSCALPRMDYVVRTTAPQLLHRASAVFDADALRCFGALTGIDTVRLTPSQQLQLTLPLNCGGMGLRPLTRTTHAAYLAAGMLALTDLIRTAPAGAAQWSTLPLCVNMQHCADELRKQGVDLSQACAYGLLDHSTGSLWQRMSALLSGANCEEVTAYVQSGLQHSLTAALETVLADGLQRTLLPMDRTRLVALSTEHAARALTVLPTEKCFRLRADEARSLCRMRLGMPPADSLTHCRCACQARQPFLSNAAHLHCCPRLKGTGSTLRHNLVLRVLAEFCRMCGCSTLTEPASLARRDRSGAAASAPSSTAVDGDEAGPDADGLPHEVGADIVGDADGSAATWQPGTGATHQVARRTDLLVSHPHYFGYADVSVAHPATATLLGRSADPDVARKPLVAAKLREAAKDKLYAACPAYTGYAVTPVVLETYGGFGPKAVSFVRQMAGLTKEPKRMFSRGMDMLATALAKGNRTLEHVGIPKALQAAHADHSLYSRAHPAVDACARATAPATLVAPQPASPIAPTAAPPAAGTDSPPEIIRMLSTLPPSRKRPRSRDRPGPLEKALRASGSHRRTGASLSLSRTPSMPLQSAPATESDEAHAVHISVDEDELAGDTARPREGLHTIRDVFVCALAAERLD
jgi:hypothetical protein